MFKKKVLKEIVWQKEKSPQFLVTTEIAGSEGSISVPEQVLLRATGWRLSW